MTTTGGGTDGREPVGAPSGGRHASAGEPTPGIPSLLRQLVTEMRQLARRSPLPVALVAGGAAITLIAVLGIAVGGLSSDDASATSPAPRISSDGTFPAPARPAVPGDLGLPKVPVSEPSDYEVAPPVGLAIPDLGIDQNMIGLRVSPDGTMQVPAKLTDIGWWAKGPKPGETGGAVLAGHVSGGGRPGVFGELADIADGAKVIVTRADGTVATYRVVSRQQFPKDDFPDKQVYTFDGPTQLHLVTCGGDFSKATGHFKDNIVVFAELVSDTLPTKDA